MSIFLLFLRRLWIALAANSRFALKQCVASNRYARKICENFSKCLGGGIPSGRARSYGKLLHFLKRCNAYIWCLWAICPYSTYKDGDSQSCRIAICTAPSPSRIKVQIFPLVRAYLWQIFAGLASRAIALKTLFERRARVCLKSNL